ncbi:hypothetical protein AGABI1DRAFT_107530 [Agaricus bisporus var. burnettii JB137-S8]|uniref:CAF1B/HIR1 beta-propeller domain-containing protein n=1 Tax=Agaricus bisporus var. burnettii (strain JB137-S8 / ATCC MYA-4627 / FGSC 10392) TaxID=597362 RepID=K5XTF6_AGABU|nr:uncharacterized protein AGABI1DRAFT_107530 [Agaricus bisporus var. burnettii JB137-S8]EKM78315.1 hypothetical protein AGABI1DRAFT_107530 [Agaricus bisporus var. burnettii JB137-S8]
MVYPNIRPTSLVKDDPNPAAPRPPRIEYLSTLSRHSAAVNVVRFSPNGEFIASAGDDGMVIIWAQSANPVTGAYGSDIPPDEAQMEKEFWKPRTTFRCTTMQVYDLAWSPTGEYIIAGSTDNTARIFASVDGKCVCEIAEHSHFVQGVAWDPLNEYIATQSSDRSMHVYRISTKNGTFEAHAVGRNTRMPTRHTRTPSAHGSATTPLLRPKMFRSESCTSDAESAVDKDELPAPLTPATSVGGTPSLTMFPPPPVLDKGQGSTSSRRSSFSASSNAPGSPHSSFRYGRSPSPMPPLPAIRSLPPSSAWANVKLYGDESFTNFFRRLTFSPDGGLLLTPAGQFEDPIIIPSSLSNKGASTSSGTTKDEGGTPTRGRKGKPSVGADASSSAGSTTGNGSTSSSSVYIYSRANFARPPIAQLPGHRKASVAVRFSPILYELRPNVVPGADNDQEPPETKTAALEKGMEGALDVDVTGPAVIATPAMESSASSSSATTPHISLLSPQRAPPQGHSQSSSSIAAPAPRLSLSTSQLEGNNATLHSPGLSPMDVRPPTPAASKPSTPRIHAINSQMMTPQAPSPAVPASTGSIFALPYRMLYAVVTMDAVAIYDTQQAGPVCLLTKLHYDEFTDMTWSSDGQTLLLSSRDGYCTIVIFDEIIPASHTQQHVLQLQSIAHQNSVPLVSSNSAASTPATSTIGLPHLHTHSLTPSSHAKKRSEPPLTPAASADGESSIAGSFNSNFSHNSGSSATTATGSTTAAGSTGSGGSLVASSILAPMPSPKLAAVAGKSDISEGHKRQVSGMGASVDEETNMDSGNTEQPPKKKRRVALTRVGDLDS